MFEIIYLKLRDHILFRVIWDTLVAEKPTSQMLFIVPFKDIFLLHEPEQHHGLVKNRLHLLFCQLFKQYRKKTCQIKYISINTLFYVLKSHTPFTPFLSLSSIKSDRYSGERELRLRKYSKSPAMVCLKSLSLLNDSRRKWSNRVFKSSRPCGEETSREDDCWCLSRS